MKYLVLIFKNLGRSKRRTILTVSSIGISLFIFAVLTSVPAIANKAVADTASTVRLICLNKAGLGYFMPEAYKRKIAAVPHVEAVVPQSWFGGIYHDVNDQFPNLAVDPDQVGVVWPDWNMSKSAINDFQKIRTAALVGHGTMERFHLHIGQQIMLHSPIYGFNLTFKIVGVTDGKAPANFLMFRRDYLEQALKRPGVVLDFVLRADSSEMVPGIIAAVDKQFANSSAETLTESDGAFMGSLLESYRGLFWYFEVLGAIVVFTILLVAANTAAMTIRERRNEVAVMRAIGFTASQVMALMIGEAVFIGVIGGALGSAAALIALRLLSHYAEAIGLVEMGSIPASVVIKTMGVAIVIGFVSAYFPARSAAHRNIVDALRTVA
ncbi:MAG: ABC transporter permease [Candidatus Binataceae bacterium]